MARLWTTGFEGQSGFLDTGGGLLSNYAYAGAGNGRNGGNAVKLDVTQPTSTYPVLDNFYHFQSLASGAPGVRARSYFQIDAAVTTTVVLMDFVNGVNSGVASTQFYPRVQWNPINQHLEVWSTVYDNSGTFVKVADTGLTMTTGAWHYFGFSADVAFEGTECFYTILLDDQTYYGNFLFVRVPQGTENICQAVSLPYVLSPQTSAAFVWVDDAAVNDNTGTGSNLNTIPLPANVRNLVAISDSSRGAFTAGAGGTTNLWDAINDAPPTGVANASATNTSQIKSTGGSGTTYIAICNTFSAAGFGSLGTTVLGAELVAIGGGQAGNAVSSVFGTLNGGLASLPEVDTNWFTGGNVGTYSSGWQRVSAGFVVVNAAAGTVGLNTISIKKANSTTNDTHCCYTAWICEIVNVINASRTTVVGTQAAVAVVAPATKHSPAADFKVDGTLSALGGVTVQGKHHHHASNVAATAVRKIVPMTTFTAVPHLGVAVTARLKIVPMTPFHAGYGGTTPSTATRKIVPVVTFTASWKSNVAVTATRKVVLVFGFYSPVSLARVAVVPVVTFKAKAVRSTGDTLLVQATYRRPTTVAASGIRRRVTKVDGG